MDEILNSLNIILHEFTLDQLHFLRAQWFYAFIPLLLFLLLSLTKQRSNKNWKSVIDPQLMPFVLRPSSETPRRRYPLLLVLIAASLCITALAGPVYKKLPQPVYQEKSSLVILLDLSQSMNATDTKPSRLARAKLELLDILKARKTGQTALIVYAADAFVVTPLTDDNATIANMIPSLETDMMPAQGSNFTAALKKAVSLFSQAGVINGDILAITDDIRKKDERAIQQINTQGHRLSIFGIGTPGGGPIPLDGGFLQDRNGAIVIAKLDSGKLQNYALQAGGLYTGLKAGDRDVEKLSRLFQSAEVKHESKGKGGDDDRWADQWREEGYWLLLPLLLLSALWARRGWLAMVSFILPLILLSGLGITPQTAYAAEPSVAADEVSNQVGRQVGSQTGNDKKPLLDTKHLWSTPDQKAMRSFKAGDNESAAQQFQSPEWKASAYYRKGDYQAAAETLKGIETSDAYYNKGNALAKLGKYQEAIKAYDKAIKLDKDNKDAAYNRDQVEQVLKKQQQQSEQDQSKQDQSDENKSDSEKSEQDKSEQQQSDQDQSEQDQSEQDQSEQQSDQDQSEQSKSDKSESGQQNADNNEKNNESKGDNKDQQNPSEENSQQAEDEELKQRDAEAEAKKQEQEKQQYEQDNKKELDKEDSAQESQNEQNNDEQKKQQDLLENTPEDDQSEDGSEKKPAEIEVNPTEASITEQEKAAEQWLKRIPDDPGGLLRRKFLYQYKNIPNQQDSDEPW